MRTRVKGGLGAKLARTRDVRDFARNVAHSTPAAGEQVLIVAIDVIRPHAILRILRGSPVLKAGACGTRRPLGARASHCRRLSRVDSEVCARTLFPQYTVLQVFQKAMTVAFIAETSRMTQHNVRHCSCLVRYAVVSSCFVRDEKAHVSMMDGAFFARLPSYRSADTRSAHTMSLFMQSTFVLRAGHVKSKQS